MEHDGKKRQQKRGAEGLEDGNNNPMSAQATPAVAVDWRGRPCHPRNHGGMRAAAFVLGQSSHLLLFSLCAILLCAGTMI